MTKNTPDIHLLHPKSRHALWLTLPLLTLGVVSVPLTSAHAADGTWTKTDGTGNWSEPANWLGSPGVVAQGIDVTAYFDQVDITADRTITLDASFTVGHLKFGDTVSSNNWTLGSSGGSVLTLDTTSGIPTIDVAAGRTATISATLGGNDGMTKTGSGTLLLIAANTFTGKTTISAGNLQLGSGSAGGSLAGDIEITNSGEHLIVDSSAETSLQGVISGAGTIKKLNSSGVLILTGNNTFTGGVTVQDGTLLLSTATNGGLGIGGVKVGYRATIRASDKTSRTINKINLNNAGGGLTLGDAQGSTTYTGDIIFSDTSTGSALTGNTKLTVTNDTTVTLNKQFTGGRINKWGTGTLILNGNSTTNGLTTANEGLLVVNGTMNNSSFSVTGGNALGSGTLMVNGSIGASAGTNTVAVGGTLGGAGSIGGATTIDGKLSPGTDAAPGALTFNTSLTLTGTANTLLEIASAELYDSVNIAGAFTYGGSVSVSLLSGFTPTTGQSYHLFNFGGSISGSLSSFSVASTALQETVVGNGVWTGTDGSLTYTFTNATGVLAVAASAIPEPSTYAVIAGGLVLGAVVIRRCRRALAEAQA